MGVRVLLSTKTLACDKLSGIANLVTKFLYYKLGAILSKTVLLAISNYVPLKTRFVISYLNMDVMPI